MNRLYNGDNLDVLREHVDDASVDLIYLDPPFNSNASYNILFKSPAGGGTDASIEAFGDTWEWGPSASTALDISQSNHKEPRSWLDQNICSRYDPSNAEMRVISDRGASSNPISRE